MLEDNWTQHLSISLIVCLYIVCVNHGDTGDYNSAVNKCMTFVRTVSSEIFIIISHQNISNIYLQRIFIIHFVNNFVINAHKSPNVIMNLCFIIKMHMLCLCTCIIKSLYNYIVAYDAYNLMKNRNNFKYFIIIVFLLNNNNKNGPRHDTTRHQTSTSSTAFYMMMIIALFNAYKI